MIMSMTSSPRVAALIAELRDQRRSSFTIARNCRVSDVVAAIKSNAAPDLLPAFAYILGERGAVTGLEPLVGLLQSASANLRSVAADAIGKILFKTNRRSRADEVIYPLIDALGKEPVPGVIADLLAALGATRRPILSRRIAPYLNSQHDVVRRGAADALGLINTPEARAILAASPLARSDMRERLAKSRQHLSRAKRKLHS